MYMWKFGTYTHDLQPKAAKITGSKQGISKQETGNYKYIDIVTKEGSKKAGRCFIQEEGNKKLRIKNIQ